MANASERNATELGTFQGTGRCRLKVSAACNSVELVLTRFGVFSIPEFCTLHLDIPSARGMADALLAAAKLAEEKRNASRAETDAAIQDRARTLQALKAKARVRELVAGGSDPVSAIATVADEQLKAQREARP